jgi:hypothetical protein
MSTRLRLRDDAHLRVHYCDETPFGSAITGLCNEVIRRTCQPILQLEWQYGADYLQAHSSQLLKRCFASQALGQLYARPGVLRETSLYPPAERVRPVALRIDTSDPHLPPQVCRLDAELWLEVARWLDAWSSPSRPPRSPLARVLWDALEAAGALTSQPVLPPRCGQGITFVGHAAVALQSAATRISSSNFGDQPVSHWDSSSRPRIMNSIK